MQLATIPFIKLIFILVYIITYNRIRLENPCRNCTCVYLLFDNPDIYIANIC